MNTDFLDWHGWRRMFFATSVPCERLFSSTGYIVNKDVLHSICIL